LQGHQQPQGQRDGRPGAELRELQPAAAEGGAGGAEQQRGCLPERQVDQAAELGRRLPAAWEQ